MTSQLFIPRHMKHRSLRAIKRMRARYELARRMLEGQTVRPERTPYMDLTETIKRAGNKPPGS